MTPAPPTAALPVIPWAQFVACYDGCTPTLPHCTLDHAGVVLYLPVSVTVYQMTVALVHFDVPPATPGLRLCLVEDAPVTELAAWYAALPLGEEETQA